MTTPTTPRQAGALSDKSIEAAVKAWFDGYWPNDNFTERMRAAISAALAAATDSAARAETDERERIQAYADEHMLTLEEAVDALASPAPSNLVDAADDLLEALRQIAEAGSAHSMPAVDMVEALRDIAKDAIKRAAPVHTETKPKVKDCPHAAPFRYCPECVVSPCPIGLGGKK